MPESIEDLIALAVSMALLWLLFGRVAVASAFRVCGIGSYGVPRPSRQITSGGRRPPGR